MFTQEPRVCEDSLSQLSWLGLAKRTLKNDLIDVCNICSFNCKDNSQILLGRAIQGQQSQIGKLNLDSRKTNFHQQHGMALEQVANETG